jgi:hypothetical protein
MDLISSIVLHLISLPLNYCRQPLPQLELARLTSTGPLLYRSDRTGISRWRDLERETHCLAGRQTGTARCKRTAGKNSRNAKIWRREAAEA